MFQIEDEKDSKNSVNEKKQVVKVYEVKIINGVPEFILRDSNFDIDLRSS